MTMRRTRTAVLGAFLWILMILLGSIVLETFMVYPNIFHDPPKSFETALAFMSVRAPNDLYPPLGFLTWVAGLVSLALAWPERSARYWIMAAVAMIMGEGLFSILFFWPRNQIMFIEGTSVHSAEFLRRTAQEFQTMHWGRVLFNASASAFAFVGFLRFYRHQIFGR
jgi:hypothetical protein